MKKKSIIPAKGTQNIKKRFNIRGRLRSFGYAGRGVWTMIRSQHNAWIHASATMLAIFAGFAFGINGEEWCRIILAIMAVWTSEALNTALEYLADAATKEFHPLVEKAKDVAAGAVLIAASGALVIGVLTFWPYLALIFAG